MSLQIWKSVFWYICVSAITRRTFTASDHYLGVPLNCLRPLLQRKKFLYTTVERLFISQRTQCDDFLLGKTHASTSPFRHANANPYTASFCAFLRGGLRCKWILDVHFFEFFDDILYRKISDKMQERLPGRRRIQKLSRYQGFPVESYA